jgi:hypothetical protein
MYPKYYAIFTSNKNIIAILTAVGYGKILVKIGIYCYGLRCIWQIKQCVQNKMRHFYSGIIPEGIKRTKTKKEENMCGISLCVSRLQKSPFDI